MTRVFQAQELVVKTKDELGMLARVTLPIAEAKINLNACFGTSTGANEAIFHLLTSDNSTARSALTKAGFKADERSVVVVETTNEIGSLAKAASQLAEAKISLYSCYATAGGHGNTWIVFGTDSIEKALNVIS